MIKKLNIALVIVMVALFALKALRDSATGTAETVEETVAAAPVASDLPVEIVYVWWPPFAMEDRIANRYGYLLDQVRAIFPRAKFRRFYNGDEVERFSDLVKTNEYLAIVSAGDHPALSSCPSSETALGWYEIRLNTLRENPWTYKDISSLAKLKIACDMSVLDSPFVQGLKSAGLLTLVPDYSTEDVVKGMREGKYDAIIEACSTDQDRPLLYIPCLQGENLRRSAPIARCLLKLHVSNKNPKVAEAILRDFEAGRKRIAESGELRRIAEYYGFRAIGDKGSSTNEQATIEKIGHDLRDLLSQIEKKRAETAAETAGRKAAGAKPSVSDKMLAETLETVWKTLDDLGLKYHRELKELDDAARLAVVRQIVAGERDAARLAAACAAKCGKSSGEIKPLFASSWDDLHLFALQQALARFDFLNGRKK